MSGAALKSSILKATDFADSTGCYVPNLGGTVWLQKFTLKRFVLRTELSLWSWLRFFHGRKYSYELFEGSIDDTGVLVTKSGGSGGIDVLSLLKDDSDTVIAQQKLGSIKLSENMKYTLDAKEAAKLASSTNSKCEEYLSLEEFREEKLQAIKQELVDNWRFSETCLQWKHITHLKDNQNLCFISSTVITEKEVHMQVENEFSVTVWFPKILNRCFGKYEECEETHPGSHAAYSKQDERNVTIPAHSIMAYNVVPLEIKTSDGSISLPLLSKAASGDEGKINASDEIVLCESFYDAFERFTKEMKDDVINALITKLNGLNSEESAEKLIKLSKLAMDASHTEVDPDALFNEVEPTMNKIDNLLKELGVSNMPNEDYVAEGIRNFIIAMSMLHSEAMQTLLDVAMEGDASCGLKVVQELKKIIEKMEMSGSRKYQAPSDRNVANFIAQYSDCSLYAWRAAYVAAIHFFGK